MPDKNGSIPHAQLVYGNGMIMLGSATNNEFHTFVKSPAESGGIGSQGAYIVVAKSGEPKTIKKPERPHYLGVKTSNDVCMISYLAQSGYMLTVVLNFSDGSTVAIASNAKDWIPAHGTFEVMP